MHPLAQAADSGDIKSVQELLDASEVGQAAKDLALARACCLGHLAVAELLFAAGGDPNGQYESSPGKFEYGPLLLASCEFLSPDGVRWLLDHGADPNGNPPESEHAQALTPLAMVQETYVDDSLKRARCRELLLAAGAREES